MTTYSLVMDLIALAVVALCAAYYARKGFISGVLSFFGTLIALVLASVASVNLSPAVFNTFFAPGLEDKMLELINETGLADPNALLSHLFTFLPESLVDTIIESIDPAIDYAAVDVSRQMVSQVLQPLITPFITVILFFVLFSLTRILVGAIRSLAAGFTRLPAMNTVNAGLGVVAGVLIAALYIYLGLCVIWAYDAMNPSSAIGPVYFSKSLIFRLFSNLNFFSRVL